MTQLFAHPKYQGGCGCQTLPPPPIDVVVEKRCSIQQREASSRWLRSLVSNPDDDRRNSTQNDRYFNVTSKGTAGAALNGRSKSDTHGHFL